MTDAFQRIAPRWRGFNLPEMFVGPGDLRWPEMIRNARGRFCLDELDWISDWGFDFVRLPVCYRWWSSASHPFGIDDTSFEPIDRAIERAAKCGLHVSLAMHHAPGFCINPPAEPDPFDLWTHQDALDCFVHHWRHLAVRYASIPQRALSFDLVNEPDHCTDEQYDRVARAAAGAIRAVSPQRTLVSNGLNAGNRPCFSLADLNVFQSCRGYQPSPLTHYLAWWAGMSYTAPAWPQPMPDGSTFGPDQLWDTFSPWRDWIALGGGVHCGEFGCNHRTPHRVMLKWCECLLDCLRRMNVGFALWNFRGSFGVLDSTRSDVAYADFRGLPLDHELLDLLRRY
jgi:endoglucanase